MAFDIHKNFAYSLVATAPSPADTGLSLIVTAGDGSKFPTPPFNAVVCPGTQQPSTANAEIVRVTNISTDTFTITRNQESSNNRSIQVGDQIVAAITNKFFTDIEQYLDQGVKTTSEPIFVSVTAPTLYGGTASGGNLTIHSTSHATKGNILLNSSGGNVGIGIATPVSKLEVLGDGAWPLIVSRISTDTLKTNTAAGNLLFLGSNEVQASNPFGLAIRLYGGAAIGNRRIDIQTMDLALAVGGNLVFQIDAGNLGIRTISFGTNADGVLGIGNGTAPTTSPADTVQLWSADLLGTAGKAGLHLRTEDEVIHSLGSDIVVGATSLTGYNPTAAGVRFLSIVRPTATSGDRATLTMVGHSAGDVMISNIVVYNSANTDSDKRMFQIEAYRDGVNNTSKIWIASKSAGTLYSSIQLSGAGDVSLGGDAYTGTQKVFIRSGGLGIGTATFGTSATNTLALLNGTAPSTSPADTVQLYSSDNSAGNTIPSFFCEGTGVLATGQADSASSVRVKMRINGTEVTLLAI
jgi:hypothetical protein